MLWLIYNHTTNTVACGHQNNVSQWCAVENSFFNYLIIPLNRFGQKDQSLNKKYICTPKMCGNWLLDSLFVTRQLSISRQMNAHQKVRWLTLNTNTVPSSLISIHVIYSRSLSYKNSLLSLLQQSTLGFCLNHCFRNSYSPDLKYLLPLSLAFYF